MRTLSQYDLLSLLYGALWTIVLSGLAFAGGALLGLVVALCRVARNPALKIIGLAYIELVQGLPLLIVLFLTYFGIGVLGYDLPPLLAAAIGLTVYSAAFLGDIWRGCIEAVPRGQWEAAQALGLRRSRIFALVILPQAFQIAIPPTVGFLVQLVKNTSVAAVIGFVELTRAAQVVNNATFRPLLIFGLVVLLYYAMCFPLAAFSRALERRTFNRRAIA